jgi:hypothetical protein
MVPLNVCVVAKLVPLNEIAPTGVTDGVMEGVTEIVGVIDKDAVTDGVCDTTGVCDGVIEMLGVTVAVVVGVTFGVTVIDVVMVGVTEGVNECVGVTEAVGVGDGVVEIVGVIVTAGVSITNSPTLLVRSKFNNAVSSPSALFCVTVVELTQMLFEPVD